MIYLLGITLYPGIYAIYQSLFRVKFNSWTFIGLDNYQKLLGDQEFWASLWNTFLMGSAALLLEFVIALTLAALAYRDPWISELAHPLPAADAVHALGGVLHLEARLQ